mmetsp:Transcript_37133/g.51539  ORF Transcript_37133/g.51539 Transcript_37133/m.51539 type:complete len:178 (-) Transcript_37133:155-688(-)
MAKHGAKKLLDQNAKHLLHLRTALIIGTLVHLLVRLILFRSSASWLNYTIFLTVLAVQVVCYRGLSLCARPTFNAQGELDDGGMDLSQGGMTSYTHDVLYVLIFLQVAGLFSDWVWATLAAVPLVLLYLAWVKLLYPYIFTPRSGETGSDGPESKLDRKRREKLERKQNCPKMKTMR